VAKGTTAFEVKGNCNMKRRPQKDTVYTDVVFTQYLDMQGRITAISHRSFCRIGNSKRE
jgi:hypothetical protein